MTSASPPPPPPPFGPSFGPSFGVLYEDNHLLIVDKPAELPTMGVTAGTPSLIEEAKEYVRRKYDKPGNVYLGIVSRLDAPVTGVVVIARTSKAAKRLTEQFRDKRVEKRYLALVSPPPAAPRGNCVDWLRKDERHRKVFVTRAGADGAREAKLSYRTLHAARERALLEVLLETGRKHQIRVQLSALGCPVVGDHKYGSTLSFPLGIALHSHRLKLEHPVRREPLVVTAPLPASWGKVRSWAKSDER
ncbi:MAG: RNA pseudouridine synthase [Planctomycetales bacterium]|nr:RNA pseudouridine synthase [Planctomycetales bacterium]